MPVNIGVLMSFWVSVFVSFRWIPSSGIAGSYSISIFKFKKLNFTPLIPLSNFHQIQATSSNGGFAGAIVSQEAIQKFWAMGILMWKPEIHFYLWILFLYLICNHELDFLVWTRKLPVFCGCFCGGQFMSFQ